MKPLAFLTWALVFLAVHAAEAQYRSDYYDRPYKSTTAEEGMLRGMGDLVRSKGEANLYNSEAARNYEEARSQDLDNRLKATETYFAMRATNKQARKSEQSPRLTSEQLFRIAREGRPKDLSPSELDPLSGQIEWPLVLGNDEYTESREFIQRGFKTWASNSGRLTTRQHQALYEAIQELQGNLSANIRNYPSYQYIQAKNFLRSLAFTLDNPV